MELQYFHPFNASFFYIPRWLYVPVQVEKILKINLAIIGLLDFQSVGVEASNVTSCFMDVNCNNITEIWLVICYTTSYCTK